MSSSNIETQIRLLSQRLSDINRVIGPNNLNSSSLAIISSELDSLEKNGENVLALRSNYALILGKVNRYQARKYF